MLKPEKSTKIIASGLSLIAILIPSFPVPASKKSKLFDLRLIDNKIAESEWNVDNLKYEIDNLKFDYDPFKISFDDLYMPKLSNVTIDIDPSDQHMKSYLDGNLKQIVLVFTNEEFEKIMGIKSTAKKSKI